MPIKIKPPDPLPRGKIMEIKFNMWKNKLEVYLNTEEEFEPFMPGGKYSTWTAAERYEDRIQTAVGEDTEAQLTKHRKQLRSFITLISERVHEDYYNPIHRHSTSLQWIYDKVRQDYDLEQQGIHFLQIIDLKWDPTDGETPIGFYNRYRSLVIGNLKLRGTRIDWKNETLAVDEELSPSHEDMIFLNVLTLLHNKLPHYIRDQYAHKIGKNKSLMDFKTEILSKAQTFIHEIENPVIAASTLQTNQIQDVQCNYIQTSNYQNPSRQFQRNLQRFNSTPQFYQRKNQFRPRQPFARNNSFQRFQSSNNSQRFHSPANQLPPYCKLCHVMQQPATVYNGHYLGQKECPSLSQKNKDEVISRFSAIQTDETDDNSQFYEDEIDLQDLQLEEQVNQNISLKCNFIQPVASQTLAVKDINNKDVFLDLDTGANVSYCKLSAVKDHGFKILPNGQLSSLADGKTRMYAIGEIDELFHRNGWQIRYHAVVTKDLHCSYIAGNNTIKENSIMQDFNAKTIIVHKKFVVPETSKSLILPTQANNILLQNNKINVIFPGGAVEYEVPHKDNTVLAIQPFHQNKVQWPKPQLCQVTNGKIIVTNESNEPVNMNKADKVQIRTVDLDLPQNNNICPTNSNYDQNIFIDNTSKIEVNNKGMSKQILEQINDIHHTYKDVFNESLKGGYNGFYGKHVVHLNWASQSRPMASKVININYDHQQKQLLQDVIDELTFQGVLGIPSEHDVVIQYAAPCFLVRKGRAKEKSKNELLTSDCRLVTNFSNLNTYLKNLPTPVTKPRDIFAQLGKWNYIINTDLFSGFFQNHMSPKDYPWLGISTPFGGMRFMKRSGQGLLAQSEELDELLAKVLGPEMKDGKVARIADDIFIGGLTREETLQNYATVLQKFQNANIKISPAKTKVFLESVDILGWKWSQGGFLSPSPHRVCALKNTKIENVKNVKDLRSFIGLFKTLLPASPNLTLLLNPLDLEVADKDSKDVIDWNRELTNHFNQAKAAVDNLQSLYLPAPSDQLLLEVDAAKVNPGIGHVLYAIKDGKKLPVSFHSAKLSPAHSKWQACEIEALAFATAINTEYDIIKESIKPVIITPDSKPVSDAFNLIKKGQYSSSPRMQAFINNVNKIPIIVQLASGKSVQNSASDFHSRNPSSCTTDHCSVCNFISETSDSVILPTLNAINNEILPSNRKAWIKIQQEQKVTREASYLIQHGKTPSKVSGKFQSEIRRLCKFAKVDDKDKLLYVPKQQNKYSSVQVQLIVIPSSHLPAVLWQLHNKLNHPTHSQLKAQFDKCFYSVGLTAILEKLYEDCFYCSSQRKIPTEVFHDTKTEVLIPGKIFHADVIKRQNQNLLTVRDHFSSLTAATIIKSESHQELKKGLIELLIPIKFTGVCEVKTDNARGFLPLLDDKDPDLTKLQISVKMTDPFNKNENSVVDKGIHELEQEIKKLDPDCKPITNTTLQLAVSQLNTKLRRCGQISSYEIHFNRDIKLEFRL